MDRALLVSFDDILDVDQVGRLRNRLVFTLADDLPKLPEGEYYHHELLGLSVVTVQGLELGFLTEILETGANDVYLVVDPDGKETLIPAIPGVVEDVDLEKRVMRVNPPEWS